MLPFEEAQRRVLALARPTAQQRVGITEALRRVCVESVVSEVALPGFDYSAMDGYAVRCGDFYGSGPWNLPVVAESRAGSPAAPLGAGDCCRIFTGAAIPEGADAVVMQENVERAGKSARFSKAPALGEHIRRRGEDLSVGQEAIAAGTTLGPFHLGLLASMEREQVLVSAAPKVTILCSGDELRRPGMPRAPGSIPESNGVAIEAMLKEAGASPRVGPLVPDDQQRAEVLLAEALASADLVVTIGGVSVGDHDVMRDAMTNQGVELDFWKVRIKPGKPLVVGSHPSAVVIGLPGNPVSAQLTCGLFVLPLVRAMQSATHCLPRRTRGILGEALRQNPGRLNFHRVRLDDDRIMPLNKQSSGATNSLADADALALVPEDSSGFDAGESVELILLRDL